MSINIWCWESRQIKGESEKEMDNALGFQTRPDKPNWNKWSTHHHQRWFGNFNVAVAINITTFSAVFARLKPKWINVKAVKSAVQNIFMCCGGNVNYLIFIFSGWFFFSSLMPTVPRCSFFEKLFLI